MRVRHLSSKEKSDLKPQLSSLLTDEEFRRLVLKGEVKLVEGEAGEQLIIISGFVMIRKGGKLFPALLDSNAELIERLPSIRVDRGAIPHIVSGAHVMRPGVTRFEGSFQRGELVVVKDEAHGKSIAIGAALEDSETAEKLLKGKIIENLHHVDDKSWKFAQQFKP